MRRERPSPRDEGFTLVEVLASLMLFTVLTTGVLASVTQAVAVTRDNQDRLVAAELLATRLQDARAATPEALVAGGTAVSTTVLGAVPYTVTRRIEPVEQPGAAGRCGQGLGRTVALRIHVEITWPGRPSGAAPVTASTVRTIDLDEALDGTGVLEVVVDDDAGAPLPGVTVILSPGSVPASTSLSGCAVFLGLEPARDYSVSLSKDGYGDVTGAGHPEKDYVVVRKSQTTRESFVMTPVAPSSATPEPTPSPTPEPSPSPTPEPTPTPTPTPTATVEPLTPPSVFTVAQAACSPAGAPAFRARSTTVNAATDTAIRLTVPATAEVGDVLIAHVFALQNSANFGITPPAGSAWTGVLAQALTSGNTKIWSGVWWTRVVPGMPGTTQIFTSSARTAALGGIAAYSGVSTARPIDAAASLDDTDTLARTDAPSVTTTVADTRLVGIFSQASPGEWSPQGALTERWDVQSTVGNGLKASVADVVLPTAGLSPVLSSVSTAVDKGIGQVVALAPLSAATADLSWSVATSGSVTGYRLRRSLAGALGREWTVAGRTTTTSADAPLVPGSSYTFELTATDGTAFSTPVTRELTAAC